MVDDDPFADPPDPDKTVIRPRPGLGRQAAVVSGRAAPDATPPEAPQPSLRAATARLEGRGEEGGIDLGLPGAATGINPLAQAASALLALAIRLKGRATHGDVPTLHARVVSEVKSFETRALSLGATPDAIQAGRYALCATIDDLVLNTPWGRQSLWTRSSLVSTFYGETWSGERFFTTLDHLMKAPERNLDVLELFYLCLSIGFEGQFRIEARGTATLARIRDELYRTIRRRRGDFERALSPNWQGIEAAHRPLSASVPVWVVAAACAVLLTIVYFGLSYALETRSDRVFRALADLPPNGPVVIERPVPVPPPPPPPPTVAEVQQVERLRRFLEPEIRENLVTVTEDAQHIVVRLNSKGLFDSGRETVQEGYLPVLDRIGRALEDEPGAIVVEGHTDDVRPGPTARFRSNYDLSVARAESVVEILAPFLSDPGRLTAHGNGDADPLVPNDSPENRAVNRRAEIVLNKQR
jgi:type VI secretion system protein ImpK